MIVPVVPSKPTATNWIVMKKSNSLPNWVMKNQLMVTVSPIIPDTSIAVNDERSNANLIQRGG